MNPFTSRVNRQASILSLLLLVAFFAQAQKNSKLEYYELRTYILKDASQETIVENFLKNAYLPGLHNAGLKNIGVFKPLETDTTFGKRIYVLVPYSSLDQFAKLADDLLADAQFNITGKEYLDAEYTNPPYVRIEATLLRAFTGMRKMETPTLKGPRSERFYELRSYEGHTEKIYKNKVKMFNEGDEVGLFKRLGFNAVFYAEVISGSRMPNLMYMTTFENKVSRDEHWNTFREDAQWKKLSTMAEYQHNVSRNVQYYVRPTEYSDY